VIDALEWKDDIPASTPNRHIFTEQETVCGTTESAFRFALRGSSGRWFVQRTHLQSGTRQRTRFYRNRALAREVFDELTTQDPPPFTTAAGGTP
jgi:hypothetical protein